MYIYEILIYIIKLPTCLTERNLKAEHLVNLNKHWANKGYKTQWKQTLRNTENHYGRGKKQLDHNMKSNTQLLFFFTVSLPAVLPRAWHFSLSLPAPASLCQIVQLRGNTRTLTGALRCFSLLNSDPSCCWMRQWRRQTGRERQVERQNRETDRRIKRQALMAIK